MWQCPIHPAAFTVPWVVGMAYSGFFYRYGQGVAIACLALAGLTACADRESVAFRLNKPFAAARPPVAKAPVPADPAPRTAEQDGPVQLSPQVETGAAEPQAEEKNADRLAFLDWFGDAADRARVKNPVAELRKSRAVTAAMTPPDTSNRPRLLSPVVVSDGSRLVPTYNEVLPDPSANEALPDPSAVQAPPLRGSDITGSVNPRAPAAKNPPASEPADDPVRKQLLKADERLRKTRQANRRHQAEIAPETTSRPHVPERDNPIRMQIGPAGAVFGQEELAQLRQLAQLHRQTGRKIRIHGVARGTAGSRNTSARRVRRLHSHAGRALAALVRFGVDRSHVVISTAEQRTAGIDNGAESMPDRDRLEFSLE